MLLSGMKPGREWVEERAAQEPMGLPAWCVFTNAYELSLCFFFLLLLL